MTIVFEILKTLIRECNAVWVRLLSGAAFSELLSSSSHVTLVFTQNWPNNGITWIQFSNIATNLSISEHLVNVRTRLHSGTCILYMASAPSGLFLQSQISSYICLKLNHLHFQLKYMVSNSYNFTLSFSFFRSFLFKESLMLLAALKLNIAHIVSFSRTNMEA